MNNYIHMKKLVIIFISIMAFTAQVFANNVKIQGKIESNEKTELKDVKIEVKGIENPFTINDDGTFTLDVPQGKYIIKFSATGHGTKTVIIEVNGNTTLDVELEKIRKSKTSRA